MIRSSTNVCVRRISPHFLHINNSWRCFKYIQKTSLIIQPELNKKSLQYIFKIYQSQVTALFCQFSLNIYFTPKNIFLIARGAAIFTHQMT